MYRSLDHARSIRFAVYTDISISERQFSDGIALLNNVPKHGKRVKEIIIHNSS